MKKNGFTLAEVLITLAIIGVVATMTLPALMNNTQEQQARTALKKAINTLTIAAETNQAVGGFDYSNIAAPADSETGAFGEIFADNEEGQTLISLLVARTAIDFERSVATYEGTALSDVAAGALDSEAVQVVYLRDGSAFYLPKGSPDEGYDINQTDNLPLGYTIVFDMNGDRAPNALSNCLGAANGAIDTDSLTNNPDAAGGDIQDPDAGAGEGVEGEDPASECTRENRVIRDQFLIRLRGQVAQPDGAAARWTYNS